MPGFLISIDPITVVVIFISTLVLKNMAAHKISLLLIVFLKDALKATVTSSEFEELKVFEQISHALLQK